MQPRAVICWSCPRRQWETGPVYFYQRGSVVFTRKELMLGSKARLLISGLLVPHPALRTDRVCLGSRFPFENHRHLWRLSLPPPSFMNLRERYPMLIPSDNIFPQKIPNWQEKLKVVTSHFGLWFIELKESQLKVDLSSPSIFQRPTPVKMNGWHHLESQWHSWDLLLAFYLCVLFLKHCAASIMTFPSLIWAQLP